MKQLVFENKSAIIIPYKAVKDYEDLFLGKRSGHLTEYMYCNAIDYYEKLVHEEKNYYPTQSEIFIIEHHKHEIANIIGENYNIIEIGPGPEYILRTKVLPLLNALKDLSSYTAMDININYAMEASKFISEQLKNINSSAYRADCTYPLQRYNEGKICLLFLGSTFSNFTDCEINAAFCSFAHLLNEGEYLIFSVDYNKDLSSLEKAYDNFYVKQLTFSIMDYFKDIFFVQEFNSKKFKFEYEWSQIYNAVHLNLISTEKQHFYFNNKKIAIDKDKKYHMIRSRKFTKKFIDEMLMHNNLTVVKRFTDEEERMVMYLVQKQ